MLFRSVTGLGPGGRPDTQAISEPVSGLGVLTPTASLTDPRPGELIGIIQLLSEYRDGPAKVDRGYCQPLWVVPAAWRIALPGGGTLGGPNVDARNPFRLVRSGGLITCQGRLGTAGPVTVGPPPGS